MKKIRTNNRVVNNSMWILAERIMQMGVSFFINIATVNYLQPEGFGAINYCASFVSVFTSIAALGLEYVIIKEFVANPDEEGTILGTALIMRILAGIFSIISIQLLVGVTKGFQPFYQVICIMVSLQLLFKISELLDFWFQSKLQSKHVSIAKGLTYVILAAWKIYIIIAAKTEAWFAFSYTLDALVMCIILFYIYMKERKQRFGFSFVWCKRLLHQSKHFILASMITVIYSEMDRIMIGNMRDDAEVAIYSTAYGLAMMWVFIPNAIMSSYRPVIMEGYAQNTNYKERMKTLYSIIIWIGIAAGLGITIFGRFILMIYKPIYMASLPSLVLLIWSTLFSHLAVARGTWLVCEGLNKYSEIFPIWGVAVNLVLNFTLIPKLGATGASIATLTTQFVITFIAPLFYKETRPSVQQMTEAIMAKDLIDRLRGIRNGK